MRKLRENLPEEQHFTMSYNGRRTHAGTMWEGRYHVRVHKPDSLGEVGAVMMTAAYIDLNPMKAGIVSGIDALGIASRTYFTLKYLSPLVASGYIAPVDKNCSSSSRRAYKLTRRGEEVAQW